MLRTLILSCFIMAAFARAQLPAPSFADADLGQLVCRVLAVDPVDEFVQILKVEVQNRGAVDVEPLEFRIELEQRKGTPVEERYRRVQLPLVRRFGRPAPAGGKQTYFLPTGTSGKQGQYRVAVTAACGSTGGAVGKPDLGIGAPTQVQRQSLVGTFPVTRVTLSNPFDTDIDVLLRVTFTQPKKSVELMGLRLAAKKQREWIIGARPGTRPFVDSDTPPGCEIKATAFEVVDWSVVAPADPAAGAALLQPAYDAWYRWPDAKLEVSGRFEFDQHRQHVDSKSKYVRYKVAGSFTLDAGGKATVKVESGTGANATSDIEEAFLQVRRPDFAALAQANVFTPTAVDRVALRGPGWAPRAGASITTNSDASDAHDVTIADGRIVSTGRGDGPRMQWETMAMDHGYLVTRQHGNGEDVRFTFGEVDGRVVPLSVQSTTTLNDSVFSRSELVLTALRFDGGSPSQPAPPAGAGVEGLRALWDASYRLPAEPIVVRAAFEVTTPGTDFMWQGRREVKGKLEMTGIGRRMTRVHFEFAGGLSPEVEMALAGAFRDRLLMWYGRDFSDREPFERCFAGATIHAVDAKGIFRVENARIREVRTDGKSVRGLAHADGSTERFEHEVIGGRPVMTRFESDVGGSKAKKQDRWTEVMTLRYTPVGEWLVPTQMKFEHIFGREWGPETIVLKDVRVE